MRLCDTVTLRGRSGCDHEYPAYIRIPLYTLYGVGLGAFAGGCAGAALYYWGGAICGTVIGAVVGGAAGFITAVSTLIKD
jgi:uncharacterized membrane protein